VVFKLQFVCAFYHKQHTAAKTIGFYQNFQKKEKPYNFAGIVGLFTDKNQFT